MPRQEKDESCLLKHVRLFAGASQGQCHSGIVSGLPAVGHPILYLPSYYLSFLAYQECGQYFSGESDGLLTVILQTGHCSDIKQVEEFF